MLDVQQFTPNELTVKTVDGFVVVDGKHEERQDEHGFIARAFTRRYPIPQDIKPENVECNLSSDGVLLISAARVLEEPRENERPVPIHQTHQPAINKKTTETPAAATNVSSSTSTSNNTSAAAPEGRVINVTLTD